MLNTEMTTNQTASKIGRKRHPFLCVEGIDGSGKTTTATLLAQALGGICYKTPPHPFAAIRAYVDGHASPCARFQFYLASVVYASAEIEKLLWGLPVVCDRYVYSTLAYHAALGVDLGNFASPAGLVMPDVTVLLVADEAERMGRLRSRQSEDVSDRYLEGDTCFMGRVRAEFRKMGLIEIDTTGLAPAEVVASILGLIPGAVTQIEKAAFLL